MTGHTISTYEQRLLCLLAETSLCVNETEPFPLSSGRYSPYYVDCKMGLALPQVRELIGDVIADGFAHILSRIDAVGGLELSAYPLSIAVSDGAYRHWIHRSLRAFVVRHETKRHGRMRQIEGLECSPDQGAKVFIVDDVLTTGQSILQAMAACRERGVDVVHTLVLIDREEDGGRQRIEATGVPFATLFTLAQLVATQERTH